MVTEVNSKIKLPTIVAVEDAVTQDPEVIKSQRRVYQVQKQAEVVDSLFWAVKSKEMKLNNMSSSFTIDDMDQDLLKESINGVMVKIREKKF